MTKSNQNGIIQSEVKQGVSQNPAWTYYVPGSDAYNALPEETKSNLSYCMKSDMWVDSNLKIKRVYPSCDPLHSRPASIKEGK